MLLNARTRHFKSQSMKLHSTTTPAACVEGTPLILKVENGEGAVLPGSGTSGEVWAGFAFSGYNLLPSTGVKVERVTVPATSPYTVTLGATPLVPSTTMLAYFESDGSIGTYDTTPDASLDYFVSGTTLTFHSSDAGRSVTVIYRRSLTAAQASLIYGESQVYGALSPGDVIRKQDVLQEGWVFTDCFDPAANWFAADIADLKAGAGGLVTRGGNGASIPGQVIWAPTADIPFLGLSL